MIQFYGSDFDPSSLKVQLKNFCTSSSVSPTFLDIKNYILSLSPGVQSSMSEVCKLLKIDTGNASYQCCVRKECLSLKKIEKLLAINNDPVSPEQSDAPTYTQGED